MTSLALNPNPTPNNWDVINYFDTNGANFAQFVQALKTLETKGKISNKAKRIFSHLYFCGKPIPCSSLVKSLHFTNEGDMNLEIGERFAKPLFVELGQFGITASPPQECGIGLFVLFMQMKNEQGEIVNCWSLRGRFRCALACCFDMEDWLNS